jgi:hypothetical protein
VRSVLFADQFASPAAPVSNALGARINDGALNSVAPLIAQAIQNGQLIDQLLLNGGQPIWGDYATWPIFGGCMIGINITVQSVSYQTPTITFNSTAAGDIVATLAIQNVSIGGDASDGCGIPWPDVTGTISASEVDVTLSVTPSVDPQTGQIVVVGAGANVGMQNYNFDFTNLTGQILNVFSLGQIGGAVRSPIENAIATAIENDLPPRLETALNALFAPITRTLGGQTITLALTPESLVADAFGMTFSCAADATGPTAPGLPSVPGSYFDAAQGLSLPTYPTGSPDLSLSLCTNAMNRALYTSWQAGFWNVHIDQQFVNAFGLNLPFSFDSNLLRSFVPGLTVIVPPGQTVPLALDVSLLCQPILLPPPNGAAGLAVLQLPEMHIKVEVDPGTGFVTLWEFAVHAEADVDVVVQNGDTLALTLTGTSRFDAEVLNTILPQQGVDWGAAVSQLVPGAIRWGAGSMQPIPLPSIGVSAPMPLQNPAVIVDGGQDYWTVHGDL